MQIRRQVLAAVGCLTLSLTVAGCGGSPQAAPTPTADPSSIKQLHTDRMRVVRVAFCDLVPRASVRAALAGPPTASRSWRNGDPVPGAGGQIGHEFGCAWSGPHSRAARAWVFARPVDPAYARTLVAAAGRTRDCTTTDGSGFGTPSVTQSCALAHSPRRIRHAGLFGDTWLTCEVTGTAGPAALRKRSDAWCAAVASALNAG